MIGTADADAHRDVVPADPTRGGRPGVARRVSAVVVNHDAGDALLACVASLEAEGITRITVVDNASTDGSSEAIAAAHPGIVLVRTGANLGYGAGVNRGLARHAAPGPRPGGPGVGSGDGDEAPEGGQAGDEFVLVSNPDVVVHAGAVGELVRVLAGDPTIAVVGPSISGPDGSRYPSARRFPSMVDAVGHAVLARVAPGNRFSRRYRLPDLDAREPSDVDWVSGACFLARRRALAELGGFDEAYFMYAEDADLCWRARRAGWSVAFAPAAAVTHEQGTSTSRRPYRMLAAHHRSVFRFAARTTTGWRRALLPAAAVLLSARLAVTCAGRAVASLRRAPRPAE